MRDHIINIQFQIIDVPPCQFRNMKSHLRKTFDNHNLTNVLSSMNTVVWVSASFKPKEPPRSCSTELASYGWSGTGVAATREPENVTLKTFNETQRISALTMRPPFCFLLSYLRTLSENKLAKLRRCMSLVHFETSPQAKRHPQSLLFTFLTILTSLTLITFITR